MRAVIVGAGMGGLMTALALRQSGVFASVDVYEQTKVPSTAGAGLNIPPNGARISRWLGVDLDGGDPKGPDGAIDAGLGSASVAGNPRGPMGPTTGGGPPIRRGTRQLKAMGRWPRRPFVHATA